MKINWGWKLTILYGGFVVIILVLVIGSARQRMDLVSSDYYAEELIFQKKIDAGKNQANLSASVDVHADSKMVFIEFPKELKDKNLTGKVQFYSPVNSDWDRNFTIHIRNDQFTIDRSKLMNTRYTLKINYTVGGKNYYQETELQLHT